MTDENTLLKCALGFAIITIFILYSFVLHMVSVPSITGFTLDVSTIADLCVAAGTIALAVVTYKSVKTSETNANIAWDALELQRLSFSKEQVIDQIKTVFDRVISDVTKELDASKRNKTESIYIHSSLRIVAKNACLSPFSLFELSSSKYLEFERRAEPALLSIKKSYPDLFCKLQERHILHLKLDSTVTSFFRDLDEFEGNLTELIKEHGPVVDVVTPFEDENGWIDWAEDEAISLDVGNADFYECPIATFRNIMVAMLVYDRWDPIKQTEGRFISDATRCFLELKDDLSDIVTNERLGELKITVDAYLKDLCELDDQILYSANTIRNDYILRYSLSADDLKSNESK